MRVGARNCLKTEFSEGRNMEAIQHMTLKLDIGDLLAISYLHTHFLQNLKGVVILLC